jgi:hypothetical protein
VAYTQQTFSLPGRRYGSFAGKESSAEPATPHTPSILTQLAPYAISGGRYVFVAKAASDEPPAPEPTVQVGLSGGSGRRYPVGNLDLKTWRKKGKRLKARVELVQKQIQVERDRLGLSTSEVRIEALKKRIAELQRVLLALLAQLDMSNKAYQEAVEEDEAMMAYLAYRRMH